MSQLKKHHPVEKSPKISGVLKFEQPTFEKKAQLQNENIGSNCFISHGVMFINDLVKKGKINRNSNSFKKTNIGNNVVIGSNATILPVKINNNVVVGAGAVVTKNLLKKGIYIGNPAKLLKKI